MNAQGAFAGVVIGELTVLACWKYTGLAFLWFNVLGCVVVVAVGLAVALFPVREDPDRTRGDHGDQGWVTD